MGRFHQYLASAIATLGVFSLGTVLGWTSPVLPFIRLSSIFDHHNITEEEKSWIGSVANLGALAGCPLGGYITDHLGRKRCLMIFTIPFIIGWVLMGNASSMLMIYIGRFVTGFCGGVYSVVTPILIGEISDDSIRGFILSVFELMLTFGILFVYIAGMLVDWKKLCFICSVPLLIFLILTVSFVPESPWFLVKKKQLAKARESLFWLQHEDNIEHELGLIQKSIDESEEHTHDLAHIFSKQVLRPVSIVLALVMFQQMSSYHAVIFYAAEIFKSAGIGTGEADIDAIILGVVQVLATIVSSLLVDRCGRRLLLIWPQLGMTISLGILSGFFYYERIHGNVEHTIIPLFCLIFFIVSFSIGIGPLAWTLMAELLPPSIKGGFTGVATSLTWFLAFIVTKFYKDIVTFAGVDGAFLFFTIWCFFGIIYCFFFVPETKGKSLEEIQEMFYDEPPESSSEPRNEQLNNSKVFKS